MDKKVMYGLGAVALIGAILYFRNKSSVVPAEEELAEEEPAEEGAGGGGAGGGGGASAPSPTDMAMGEVAKEELRKSMDLGGLDMASPKAEKGAIATGMVASMVASGKQISPTMGRAVLGAKLPPATKTQIMNKVVETRPVSKPITQQVKGVANKVTTTLKNVVSKSPSAQVSKAIAKSPAVQVQKEVVKAVAKPVVQVSKAVAKPVAQVSKAIAKPVVQVSKAVAKPVAKPVAQVRTAVAKPVAQVSKVVARTPLPQVKRAVTQPFKKFDGEDMFENAVSTNKQCKYVNEIVGHSPITGHPIIERKLVCVSLNNTARFDGDYEMSNFSGASDF